MPMKAKSIQEVLKENTDKLLSVPGVVGTGLGELDRKPCIKVYVAKKTPVLLKQIPPALGGYTIDVQESGEIRALGPCHQDL